MSAPRRSILDCIGSTPIVELPRIGAGLEAQIFGKLELLNPGGSVKDRIGIAMIDAAEAAGKLAPGGTIVEATAGNTGVGLAQVAALRGYKTIFVMPEKMSAEKVALLEAYGARIVRTPTEAPSGTPEHYASVAERIARETPGGWLADQFENDVNREAHYRWTGPELWCDMNGDMAAFVAGMGTTGTISGVGRYLKEQDPSVQVVVADPEGSWFGGGPCGKYQVEGIGNDHDPGIYDKKVVDAIETVSDKESFVMARRLATEEGILAGGSAGCALVAARRVAERLGRGRVVALIPDTGRNYLGKLHSAAWLEEHGYTDEDEG